MNNNQETSAGAVIYKKEQNILMFLLIYSVRNKEWGFPKGHLEQGETDLETARREVLEETGIKDISFNKKFRYTDSYKIKGVLPNTIGRIINKNVIYYLGHTKSNFVCPNDEEIGQCEWVKYEDALQRFKYEQQREILKKVFKFIQEEEYESGIR